MTFKYDPFGRRIEKISPTSGTTIYAYDGDNIIEELNTSGSPTARFTQGLGIDEPLEVYEGGKSYYYHADGLGSVVALTKSTGTAANTYFGYNTFGGMPAPTETVANPFRFTGREWDSETSLYYYRARYYDPLFGRFLSEDPIGFEGGVDFYAYVGNNPTAFVDASGLSMMPCLKVCADLLKKIENARNDLAKRFDQYLNPKYTLPLTGPMSRQSHIDAMDDLQKGLRNNLQKYNDLNCPTPIPVDAWRWATKPAPQLSPSPKGLPPLPFVAVPWVVSPVFGLAMQGPGMVSQIVTTAGAGLVTLMEEGGTVVFVF